MKKRAPKSRGGEGAKAVDRVGQLERELAQLRENMWLERADFQAVQQSTADSQRELELSRERLVELYDQAPMGCALLDRNGFIREANLTLGEMLGVERHKLVGTLLSRYILPAERRMVLHHLSRCRKTVGEATVATGITAVRPDGGRIVLLLTSRTNIASGQIRLYTSVLDITARREAEEAMRRMNRDLETRTMERARDLRSLANEILRVEERERFRLANDIHDGLTQLLVSANLRLGRAALAKSERACRTEMRAARGLLEEALQAARSLTFNLSPPALRELGLVAAARWLANDIRQRFKVHVTVQGDEALATLPDAVKLLLFRCLRELLVNAGKHARAKQVKVKLSQEDGTIRMDVTDDGRGFARGRAPGASPGETGEGGFGLFSIRERLEHLGGSMQIKGAPGKGTRVRLLVPVEGITQEGEMK